MWLQENNQQLVGVKKLSYSCQPEDDYFLITTNFKVVYSSHTTMICKCYFFLIKEWHGILFINL